MREKRPFKAYNKLLKIVADETTAENYGVMEIHALALEAASGGYDVGFAWKFAKKKYFELIGEDEEEEDFSDNWINEDIEEAMQKTRERITK